jgi:hypothetical protein
MLKAFTQGLNICPLLDSQIMQTMLSAEILEHYGKWCQFHENRELLTIDYPHSFMSLLHDELAYSQLFGESFPNKSNQTIRKFCHEAPD